MHRIKFKDFITLQRGFDLPKKDRIDGEYPVVASTSITGYHNEFKVEPPGVTTGRSGSLGEVLYLEKNFWPLNTSLWVKDFKGNLPHYVYYFLKTLNLQDYNSGAGVPTLNRNHLDNIEIDVHDENEQQIIASILSAFDDLIENNTRRIVILEEMARLIYREWFVHYRYPGHENDEMIGSGTELGEIPEDWEVKSFSEIAEFQNGKAFKPKHWQDEGLPIVKIRELKSGFSDNTAYYHGNDIDKKYYIDDGALLFAWSASLGIFLWYRGEALLNQHIFNVSPTVNYLTKDYLYYALDVSLKEFLTKTAGTTMQHIRKSALDEVHIALPPHDIYRHFDNAISPINRQILTLHKNVQKLRETRDLLLPKLISGKIEVQ